MYGPALWLIFITAHSQNGSIVRYKQEIMTLFELRKTLELFCLQICNNDLLIGMYIVCSLVVVNYF